MRERYQLFFGLRLASKKFHHCAILSSNESAPANRKTGFYADRDPNKQEVGFIFA
jgi:hypothetical protein